MLLSCPVLHDHKCYKQFSWSKELPEFKRYNLLFGWNGSGKSTLAALLQSLQYRRDIHDGEVQFKFTHATVDGRRASGATLPPIRVFNARFVNENVLQLFKGLEPIVFLGNVQVEAARRKDELEPVRTAVQEDLARARREAEQARRTSNTYREESAKRIKEALRTGGPADRFTNYDKGDFARACESVVRGERVARTLAEHELDEAMARKSRTGDAPAYFRAPSFPELDEVLERLSAALAWSPAESALQAFHSDRVLWPWLREGLDLHQHRGSDSCLFCEGPLQSSRLAALTKVLDSQLRTASSDTTRLKDELERLHQGVLNLRVLPPGQLFADEQAFVEPHLQILLEQQSNCIEALRRLTELTGEKIRNPAISTSIDSHIDAIHQIRAAWDKSSGAVAETVARHNEAIQSVGQDRLHAKELLESHFLAEASAKYAEHVDALNAREEEVNALQRRLTAISEELDKIEAALRNTSIAAEQINRDLELYLGHSELKLLPRQDGYSVTRHGSTVEDLSEGEKTALALLYFLKSLQGADCAIAETIVVIDDPVSSLDSGAIFTAFGFLRTRTEAARQLFVLTHDASLLRLVKGWLNQSKEMRRNSEMYMVRAEMREGRKHSAIVALPALLRDYESEYQYLFSVIYSAARNSESTPVEQYMLLPNAARRFTEQFLSFRYGHITLGHSTLLQALQSTALPPESVTRLYRFINVHSHEDAIAEPAVDVAVLAECRVILADVVRLVELEDPRHFEHLKRAALATAPVRSDHSRQAAP
jgi:wobble nucleotide-excising tRNase